MASGLSSETEALDVNRNGLPDLQITFDGEAYCVNLTRMPTCAAFGEFAFAFSGPTDHYGTFAFAILAPPPLPPRTSPSQPQ